MQTLVITSSGVIPEDGSEENIMWENYKVYIQSLMVNKGWLHDLETNFSLVDFIEEGTVGESTESISQMIEWIPFRLIGLHHSISQML